MSRIRMSRTKAYLFAALAFAIASGAVFAESIWVSSDSVDVRGGKGAVYPSLATVTKGQQLTVISRDGKWVQVQAPGGVTGWVYESSTSAQKVSAGGGMFDVKPGAVADVGTGAAAKGLGPSAETYVSAKHLDKAPLEWLINFRKGISPAEWEKFTTDGQVGPAAQH